MIPDTPIISRFRAALDALYGDRLARAVLFGSRARVDSQPDSDYDVAVFLKTLPDRWAALDQPADLRVEFLDKTGAFFDAKPYEVSAYRGATPLMHESAAKGWISDSGSRRFSR